MDAGRRTELLLRTEAHLPEVDPRGDPPDPLGSFPTPADSEHELGSTTPNSQLGTFDFNFNQTCPSRESDTNSVCGRTGESSEGSRNQSPRFLLRQRTQRKMTHEKVRLKRQTLQDMARPLKQWLFRNRNNPYPTKTEKMSLARVSKMTLTQVSNWFANARRRLKNTVRDPDLNWASRIKLYNNYAVGNAELFSISSNDSIWDSEEDTEDQRQSTFPESNNSVLISSTSDSNRHSQTQCPALSRAAVAAHASQKLLVNRKSGLEDSVAEDYGGPAKYKHTILQRYLNDSYHHSNIHIDPEPVMSGRYRRQSGSLGSRDYEEMSTSSGSTPLTEGNHCMLDDLTDEVELLAKKRRRTDENGNAEEYYWKEISAALALTSLARSRKDSG
ncbi:homeobox protein Mohawk-like isoform X2 [Liolophura sinensis]|uniref:homeobox protein Mohawk-like isoform X2 n=1 Tax=Liolophura sinensis TaxID=3198878 RepID=UPI0031583499